jgi:uncharacterized membrane protein
MPMLHHLRPTIIAAAMLLAFALPAQAQTCANTPPGPIRGEGPSGPDGPGYRPLPPAGSTANTLQGEPAPGFAADQSGRNARTYSAVGNEPGWSAEVKLVRPRTMQVKTDNGAKTYDVSGVRVRSQGWSGTAADGTAVRVNCDRTACQDTMSGKVFPGTATLIVGKKTVTGCGGFRQ